MRLSPPVVLIAVAVFAWEQADENHADQKAADVGPICHAASFRRSCETCGATEELDDEPKSEDDEGGDLDKLDEDENGNERQHARSRIRHQIRAEHAGNGSAGADAWNCRVVVQHGVEDSGSNAAQQIEYEVREVAEAVFDVVSENPQVPHVSDQMKPPAVQKHGREKRYGDHGNRFVCTRPCEYKGRHNSILHQEAIEITGPEREFIEKHQDVRDYQ